MLVHDAQTAQHLVEQRADGGFSEDLLGLQVARGDDEILQGRALQVVHHHINGFVLAEEVEHAHHRGVRDLRERAAFFKEAFEAEAVERELFGRNLGQQLSGRTRGQGRGQVFLDGHLLAFSIQGQIDHPKTTGRQPAHHAVAANCGIGRQGCRLDF